jgi:DNA end-binding protein Ku
MAEKLIEGLSTEFKPEQYHDEYRQRVLELVQKKAHGESVVSQPKHAARETRAADLMAALEASLSKARNKKNPSDREDGDNAPKEPAPRRKRSPAHAHETVADKPARRRKSA